MSRSGVFVLGFVRLIPHSVEVVIVYILGLVTKLLELRRRTPFYQILHSLFSLFCISFFLVLLCFSTNTLYNVTNNPSKIHEFNSLDSQEGVELYNCFSKPSSLARTKTCSTAITSISSIENLPGRGIDTTTITLFQSRIIIPTPNCPLVKGMMDRAHDTNYR